MAKSTTAERISPEDFVKLWQKCETKADFCEKTGLTKAGATSRASGYRRNGVDLKHFPRGAFGPRVDYTRLMAVANEHAPAISEESEKKGKRKGKKN